MAGAEVVELGTVLPAWSALPFVGLLLSIALLSSAGAGVLASSLSQGDGGLGAADAAAVRRGVPGVRRARGAPHRDRRLRALPDPPGGAVHHQRRHLRARFAPRNAMDERRDHPDRDGARLVDRDHRRVDADPATAAPRQPRPAAQGAHGRLLHLPGGERGRRADAARRSAALPRLPPPCPLLLDVGPLPEDAARDRRGPRRVPGRRLRPLEPRGSRAPRRPGASSASRCGSRGAERGLPARRAAGGHRLGTRAPGRGASLRRAPDGREPAARRDARGAPRGPPGRRPRSACARRTASRGVRSARWPSCSRASSSR